MSLPNAKWEAGNQARQDGYAQKVEQLYRSVISDVARSVAQSAPVSSDTPFNFDDYPALQGRVSALLAGLAANVSVVILSGISSAWNLSNAKNDELVSSVFADAALSESRLAPFNRRNLDALASFQARTVGGLNLSSRIWMHTRQFRGELELGIDTALLEGVPASRLATTLKQYLNRPDDLFRRVRGKRGNLVLSKHASNFHPGQGIYRSSYKNAERVARTEINSAYRTADFERYQQLPFVVGFEVRRSNRITSCDVCPSLAGNYPPTFKFVGWHSNCLCTSIPILATKSELNTLTRSLMAGNGIGPFQSVNRVESVNQGYTDWIDRNRERLQRAKSLPGFITDNPVYSSGL